MLDGPLGLQGAEKSTQNQTEQKEPTALTRPVESCGCHCSELGNDQVLLLCCPQVVSVNVKNPEKRIRSSWLWSCFFSFTLTWGKRCSKIHGIREGAGGPEWKWRLSLELLWVTMTLIDYSLVKLGLFVHFVLFCFAWLCFVLVLGFKPRTSVLSYIPGLFIFLF